MTYCLGVTKELLSGLGARFVRPVLAPLEKNPGDAERPIAEVFYEALSAAYPCR